MKGIARSAAFLFNYKDIIMAYATNTEKYLARLLGYKVSQSVMWGNRFQKEQRRVWATAEGNWQTADIVNGYYTNHKLFADVRAALARPL